MQATKQYLNRHGRPVTFYSDKADIFRVNQKRQDEDKAKQITQFARALQELNIDIICANSTQSKGRLVG